MKTKKALAWLILSCLVLALSFALINTKMGLTGNVIASLEKFKLMPSRAESTAVLESAPLPTMCDGLNLTKLPKIYPERTGTNYDRPGKYNVSIGDGFIKGDVLIKILNLSNEDAKIEVFKKECDGRYYPIFVPNYYKTIRPESAFDLFGLTLEIEGYPLEITPFNATFIYHENCTAYYDYCYDPSSWHYDPNPLSCSPKCNFEAFYVPSATEPSITTFLETKVSDGRFTVVLPAGYDALAEFTLHTLNQCYNNITAFLDFEPFRPRVGIKVYEQAHGSSAGIGEIEHISMAQSRATLDRETADLSRLEDELELMPCPNIFLMGHELIHLTTKGITSENRGLNEGIARYVEQQLMYDYLMDSEVYTFTQCFEDNYDGIPYANLSSSPTDLISLGTYYQTGLCFWKDYVNEYGYANFTKLMKEAYTKSRGVGKYYLLDIIQDVIGEPVSDEILERYSLTRQATMINACEGCEVYMPKYVLKKPITPAKNIRPSIFRFFGKRV
ncbi:MAG: hypothetical protein WC852_02155 [Candidatus Nanoarchaeia archaeon]|jgi:hypothetical protein